MTDYTATGWQTIFEHNQLPDFAAWWDLDIGWFEPRNERRGGWSGVSRLELTLSDGKTTGVFLKRQQNHTRKTLRHPVAGEQTFVGELHSMWTLANLGVNTLEPLYFGQRKLGADWQTILVTRELAGYQPLQKLVEDWQQQGWGQSRLLRRALIPGVASLLQQLHQGRWVHNCLYPKHLFVHPETLDVRVIDLEKMRRVLSQSRAALRDLDTLNRRSRNWSRTDRLRLLLAYQQLSAVNEDTRRLWRKLQKMSAKGSKK